LSEVFADPQVEARGMVLEMEHATGGMMKMIANPVKLSETPPDYRLAPPVLGQHTDAVLSAKLGLDAAELARLREKGII
jgi:crotonobetainyl-CoA:carnitine CoA-transferase CaiB-like acyl-CoA transferase